MVKYLEESCDQRTLMGYENSLTTRQAYIYRKVLETNFDNTIDDLSPLNHIAKDLETTAENILEEYFEAFGKYNSYLLELAEKEYPINV